MKAFLVIINILIFSSFYGQTGWTSYPIDIPVEDSLDVELVDIQQSEYTFYYRLLMNGQTVDIYSKNNETYEGTIINSIKEYDKIKTGNEYRTEATMLYTDKVAVDTSTASVIAYKILESEQPSIPTDTLIDTWTRWYLHCGNLNFEIKHDGNYYEQSFHCPWSQPDSVEFKDVILSNYDLLKQELKLDSIYHAFFWTQLPKGKTYSRSGYGMTYIMTEEEETLWKKGQPRRDHLKSIKDTIDSFLRLELENQKIQLNDVDCYELYNLTFSEKGRLVKIAVSKDDKPNIFDGLAWYFEDKKEIRKCKKLIRKAFQKIDLESFNLQYKVYRTLSFSSDGHIKLSDFTIY
jgi:hypothetical protein